jgi:hypothetical protein
MLASTETVQLPTVITAVELPQPKVETKPLPKASAKKAAPRVNRLQNANSGRRGQTRPQPVSPVNPPANNPGPIVTPKITPVQAKSARPVGFSLNASGWTPEVVRNTPVDIYLNSIGVTPRYNSTGNLNNTNLHPCQAAERAIATARTLGLMYSNGIRKMTGVYGSPRDESIVSFCNAGLADAQKMNYVRYTPALTPKDYSRNPTNITYGDAVRDADSLLLVDIYQTDVLPSCPFNPLAISRMLEAMQNPIGANKIYWVGRCFRADTGLVCGEGGWYREKDDVIFRSSKDEPLEYKHDACDWIWKTCSTPIVIHGHNYQLAWSVQKLVGTFKIVVFHVTPGRLETCSADLYPYIETFINVRCHTSSVLKEQILDRLPFLGNVLRKWNPFFEEKRIYKPIYLAARKEAQNKRYTQTNYARVSNVIQSTQDLDPDVLLFLSLFPQFRIQPADIASLTWGVLTDDLAERRVSLKMAHAIDGADMALVNDLQGSIGATPSPTSSLRTPFIIAGVLGAAALLWKGRSWLKIFRQSPNNVFRADWHIQYPYNQFLCKPFYVPSTNLAVSLISGFVISDIIHPTMEEILKRVLGCIHLGAAMPVYEFFLYMNVMCTAGMTWQQAAAFRSLPLAMHLLANRMKFKNAILFHILWNAAIAPIVQFIAVQYPEYTGLSPLRETLLKGRISLRYLLYSVALIGSVYWLKSFLFPSSSVDEYSKWKKVFYENPWEDREVYEDTRSFACPIVDPAVPESTSPIQINNDLFKNGPGSHCLSIVGTLTPPVHEKRTQHFYHILPTSAPGFVPAANHDNLVVAIQERLLKNPPMLPLTQERHWSIAGKNYGQGIFDYLGTCEPINDDWEDLVDDWLSHFTDTKKKKRYHNVVEELRREQITYGAPKTTPLFVKHDEMLMQQKDGRYNLKPRVIANLDPKYQAVVGPYVYLAQKRLGKLWSVDNPALNFIDFKGFTRPTEFHFMTGGGASDHDISRWMQKLLLGELISFDTVGFAILVCGDDSVVAYSHLGNIVFFEGDASMFDQSLSYGPIKWGLRVLRHLGVHDRILCGLLQAHSATYEVRNPNNNDSHHNNFQLNLFNRPMQATGIATTYVLNSIVMASAWFFVLRKIQKQAWTQFNMQPLTTLCVEFKDLGLDMKMQVYNDWRSVSFLKGMWYETPEPVWGPLPSRILKMGKSLRDPRTLYRITAMREAGDNFLKDVASSYSVFLQVPILRAFVQRYTGNVVRPHSSARVSQYSTSSSGQYRYLKLDEKSMVSVCNRYSLTINDIRRVEQLILNSEAFTFLHDPAFQLLAARDYA